uniref:protein FAM117B-like isoform X2 n=1 Tax=Panthera onca TaxID=9690 RepID=UPI0029558371|nr:protein FAM117B-like isoform X2 [Panthera onca]
MGPVWGRGAGSAPCYSSRHRPHTSSLTFLKPPRLGSWQRQRWQQRRQSGGGGRDTSWACVHAGPEEGRGRGVGTRGFPESAEATVGGGSRAEQKGTLCPHPARAPARPGEPPPPPPPPPPPGSEGSRRTCPFHCGSLSALPGASPGSPASYLYHTGLLSTHFTIPFQAGDFAAELKLLISVTSFFLSCDLDE